MSWLLWLLCLLPPVLLVLWDVDLTDNSPFVLVDVAALVVIAGAVHWIKRLPPTGGPNRRLLPAVALSLLAGLISFGVAWWDPQLGWAMGSGWAVAILTGLVVSRAQGTAEWIGAGALGAYAFASPFSLGLPDGAFEAPFMSTVVATSVGIGLSARSQRRLAAAQRRAAVAQKRQAMAAELHDIIAHEVTGIVVLAQALRPQASEAGIGAPVGSIEAAGLRTLQEIRTLVGSSVDSVGSRTSRDAVDSSPSSRAVDPGARYSSSAEGVRALVDAFAATKSAAVTASLPTPAEWAALDPAVATAAHRIVAEALTNTRRHAATAEHVEVVIVRGPRELVLCIRDDGAGGGIGRGGGVGLPGTADRAAGVGGHAEAGPGNPGWVVRATLPCGPPGHDDRSDPTDGALGTHREVAT